jgi:hypothetical protein
LKTPRDAGLPHAQRSSRGAHRLFVRAACSRRRAAIDLGFPCRYTHSALEVCDLSDLVSLSALLVAGLSSIEADFSFNRDDYPE